jgi:hypothetical protein
MKPSVEYIVYFVGLCPLAFFYSQLKSAFGSELLFFFAGILYLVALRVVGKALARKASGKGLQ